MNDSIKIKIALERLLGVKFDEIKKVTGKIDMVRCFHVHEDEKVYADNEEVEPILKYDYEEVILQPIGIEGLIVAWAGKCKKCGKAYAAYARI